METMVIRPLQLANYLSASISAGHPVLVTGAPGIGKSDIIAQAARTAGAEVILSHPVVSDPTDAKGLPWKVEGENVATFLPFGDLARALDSTVSTVWFLDDLGQASPAVQASFMQLLLARRVNGHILPDCVTFVAATNRRTDRAGVSGVLEPVKGRFYTILELEPSLDDWSNWAIDNDIVPELIAFLRFRPDLLSAFEPTADLTNSPTPRTWSHVSSILNYNLSRDIETLAICGAVGEGAGMEFMAFLAMYQDLPNIDAILVDPDASAIPEKPATLYALTTGLAMRANDQTFGRIAKYAQRIVDAGHGEFGALLLRDCLKRDESPIQSPDGVRLISGDLGKLISGGL